LGGTIEVMATSEMAEAQPAILRGVELFVGLPASELRAIEEGSEAQSLKNGQIVFEPGEIGSALFVLEKGTVQTFRKSGRKKLIIAELAPGAVFGEMGCVGQCIYHCSAMATQASQVRVISRSRMEELMARHPIVTRRLLDLVSERFLHVLMDLEDISFRALIPRMARLLLERADGDCVLNVTHKEMAEHLRVYRESATAALGELRKAGIVSVRRKQIRIMDRTRLERAARE
jgi:CRP-like cAMP-binding protein